MRVLIIEDNLPLQEMLVEGVKKLAPDATVDTSETADETITFMETQRLNPNYGYNLIISDVSLKGRRNGFDLWRVCATQYPETAFMFISGISTVEFLSHLKEDTRCPPFLCKPFPMKDFLNLVKQLLGRE